MQIKKNIEGKKKLVCVYDQECCNYILFDESFNTTTCS